MVSMCAIFFSGHDTMIYKQYKMIYFIYKCSCTLSPHLPLTKKKQSTGTLDDLLHVYQMCSNNRPKTIMIYN